MALRAGAPPGCARSRAQLVQGAHMRPQRPVTVPSSERTLCKRGQVQARAAVNSLGAPVTEGEYASRGTFLKDYSESSTDECTSAAVDLLRTAATMRGVDGRLVEGAMLYLEGLYVSGDLAPASQLPMNAVLQGRYEVVFSTALVFSSASSTRALLYVPVLEYMTFDAGEGSIAMSSKIGPFSFNIAGKFKPGMGRKIDYAFDEMDIAVGSKTWNRDVKGTLKTYDYYFVNKDFAIARSSAGGMTLQLRT